MTEGLLCHVAAHVCMRLNVRHLLPEKRVYNVSSWSSPYIHSLMFPVPLHWKVVSRVLPKRLLSPNSICTLCDTPHRTVLVHACTLLVSLERRIKTKNIDLGAPYLCFPPKSYLFLQNLRDRLISLIAVKHNFGVHNA